MSSGKSVGRVYVFGTFDGLHPGHWWFFRQARWYGSHLTAVIGRDVNVARIKGRLPMFSEWERARRLERSRWADEVKLGGTGQPFELLQREPIDTICLGYDQQPRAAVLRAELERIGKSHVQVVRLRPLLPWLFKSSLLKRWGLVRVANVENRSESD